MHNKMYKAGWSSNIQIVNFGPKAAVYTLGFVYVHVYIWWHQQRRLISVPVLVCQMTFTKPSYFIPDTLYSILPFVAVYLYVFLSSSVVTVSFVSQAKGKQKYTHCVRALDVALCTNKYSATNCRNVFLLIWRPY